MARKQAKVLTLMLVCVAIAFTVIIYQVAASKDSSSSNYNNTNEDQKIDETTEEEKVTSTHNQSPPTPIIQTSDDLTVIMGTIETGDTIPKGSTVYHLENGITEVHTPEKGCVLRIKDSETVLIDTPNGMKPSSYVFNVPSGAVIEDNGSEIIIYDNFNRKEHLFTIINQSDIKRSGPIVGPWLAQVKDWSISSLSHFRADWSVPDEPTNSDVTQFYFNGIQHAYQSRGIIQPVLEWNQAGSNRWTGRAWYFVGNGKDQIGTPINCNVDDSITGTMTRYSDYWWVSIRDNTTDQRSSIWVSGGSMPFNNLAAFCVYETGGTITQPNQEMVGSCYFDDIVLLDGTNEVDVDWEVEIDTEVQGIVTMNLDLSQTDDSWVNILTPNPNNQWVDIWVRLQGSNRPEPDGWHVPVNVGFYPPNSDDAVLLNPNAATYYFNGEANYTCPPIIGPSAFFHCPGKVAAGSYDITMDSNTTLLNVNRAVNIQY